MGSKFLFTELSDDKDELLNNLEIIEDENLKLAGEEPNTRIDTCETKLFLNIDELASADDESSSVASIPCVFSTTPASRMLFQ